MKWTTPGGGASRYLEVQVALLQDASNNLLGVSITFNDISRYKQLQEELERSNQELETTNEELQSNNEELETINEELQSTNEELRTINKELHRRSNEINEVNSFLQSILSSLRSGVVVVNRDLQIQNWNYTAEDLWGLRSDEVQGQDILGLDIGLPMEPVVSLIRACLAGASGDKIQNLPAINRRGRRIRCRVSCSPLTTPEAGIQGAILLMDEQQNSDF